jgi:hypothetical protein
MQLLLYQSASSAVILSGAIFFFDDYKKIPEYNFTVDGTVWNIDKKLITLFRQLYCYHALLHSWSIFHSFC